MSNRWSESVGPHGARVRVEERKRGGNVYALTWDGARGQNRKESLGFKVRGADGKLIDEAVKRAKKEAAKRSNETIMDEVRPEQPEPLTIAELFRLFRRDECDHMDGKHKAETKRALTMWGRMLGPRRAVETIGAREWRTFQRLRGSGEIDATGERVPAAKRRKVGARTVAKDLKVLRQACIYGTTYRDADSGVFLLTVDPTRGLDLPSEKNPARPVATDAELAALLEAAPRVTMRRGKRKVRAPLAEMVALAAYTGRRRRAWISLRWSDWLPDEGTHGAIRWRAETDKLGRESVVPVHPKVRETLEAWRSESPGLGDAWIFPAPESKGHIRGDVAYRWLLAALEEAKLPHRRGFGFHAFRRMWATKRKDLPAQDVAHVGGWKDTATLQRVYQQPDPDTMADVVLADRKLSGAG